MTILVTGGAGYIGSHTVKALVAAGHKILVFDNLSNGRREFITGFPFVEGDLLDKEAVREVFSKTDIGGVLHFASLIQVGESYADPAKYYNHNIRSSFNLFDAMLEYGVKVLIFSSSAAVYGVPKEIPITENHPLDPANPYGQTKSIVERILVDYDRAYDLRYISLRYFNAAGADPSGKLGEVHDPETHLIPNIMLSLLGRKSGLEIFGTDFPTPDGTAVRDYIHVTDLASAHVLALDALLDGGASDVVNLGANRAHSVLEVIEAVETVTKRKVSWEPRPRRLGDVPVLLASREKAERLLGWRPEHSTLETIIETAWRWHQRQS